MSYRGPCDKCGGSIFMCTDSRQSATPGIACRRVHECASCKNRVYTKEVVVRSDDSVVEDEYAHRVHLLKDALFKTINDFFPASEQSLSINTRRGPAPSRRKGTRTARLTFAIKVREQMISKMLTRARKTCPECNGIWRFSMDPHTFALKGACYGSCGGIVALRQKDA